MRPKEIMKPRRHLQLKQPRLAELIAVNLRDRILASEFADGANLPKQEDLLDEFGVSPPSIREALRILETEGLVSVKRGNVGGAVVLQPRVEKVAYMLALVMQASSVSLGDVSHALVQLEIPCAAECARRPDRDRTVVPRLRAVLDESRAVIGEPADYMASARRFHEEMVNSCGNETMILVVGTLESLWSAQVRGLLAGESEPSPLFKDLAFREQSLEDHEALLERIAAGDDQGAEAVAHRHLLERPAAAYPFSYSRTVIAGLVRDDYGNVSSQQT
jgi:GntR family transcriptional regulator, transcriptional repressor for pyruvate dehydrogenase complex